VATLSPVKGLWSSEDDDAHLRNVPGSVEYSFTRIDLHINRGSAAAHGTNHASSDIMRRALILVLLWPIHLAARGETPAAFGRRCIPSPPHRAEKRAAGTPGSGCVAPRSTTPGIAPHRAQHARWGPRSALVAPFPRGPHGADCAPWGGGGRIAALGATLDFHHGLLGAAENVRVGTRMQNVLFHLGNGVELHVRTLSGQLVSATAGTPPVFDDVNSYVLEIDSARVSMTPESLTSLMNNVVFADAHAPIRKLKIAVEGSELQSTGVLEKGVGVPFTMRARVDVTSDGRIRMHPTSMKAAGFLSKRVERCSS
jgi:hypothetical protein